MSQDKRQEAGRRREMLLLSSFLLAGKIASKCMEVLKEASARGVGDAVHIERIESAGKWREHTEDEFISRISGAEDRAPVRRKRGKRDQPTILLFEEENN